MIKKTEITAATLASALTLLASSASAAPVADQPSKDKCSVALKGHNDCAAVPHLLRRHVEGRLPAQYLEIRHQRHLRVHRHAQRPRHFDRTMIGKYMQ